MTLFNDLAINLSALEIPSVPIPSEDRVFITTNESKVKNSKKILERWQIEGAEEGHIGVAGWHNYDIAVLTKSSFIIITDISERTIQFHRWTIKNLKEAESKEDFIKKMSAEIASEIEASGLDDLPTRRYNIMTRDPEGKIMISGEECLTYRDADFWEKKFSHLDAWSGFWTSTVEGFKHIKRLAEEGKIIPLKLNLSDSAKVGLICDELKKNSLTVGTLYLSNVFSWLGEKKKEFEFSQSVRNIGSGNDHLLVIDAVNVQSMKQSIFCFNDPQSGEEYSPSRFRGNKWSEEDRREYFEEVKREIYPGALQIFSTLPKDYDSESSNKKRIQRFIKWQED